MYTYTNVKGKILQIAYIRKKATSLLIIEAQGLRFNQFAFTLLLTDRNL